MVSNGKSDKGIFYLLNALGKLFLCISMLLTFLWIQYNENGQSGESSFPILSFFAGMIPLFLESVLSLVLFFLSLRKERDASKTENASLLSASLGLCLFYLLPGIARYLFLEDVLILFPYLFLSFLCIIPIVLSVTAMRKDGEKSKKMRILVYLSLLVLYSLILIAFLCLLIPLSVQDPSALLVFLGYEIAPFLIFPHPIYGLISSFRKQKRESIDSMESHHEI